MSTTPSAPLRSGFERRRAPRVAVPAAGWEVSVVGARLRDVSAYGMMIESPVALTVDSELQFRLVVEGEKTDVGARVAACAPLSGPRRAYGVGLEFTRIDEDVRARLARVLARAGT